MMINFTIKNRFEFFVFSRIFESVFLSFIILSWQRRLQEAFGCCAEVCLWKYVYSSCELKPKLGKWIDPPHGRFLQFCSYRRISDLCMYVCAPPSFSFIEFWNYQTIIWHHKFNQLFSHQPNLTHSYTVQCCTIVESLYHVRSSGWKPSRWPWQ